MQIISGENKLTLPFSSSILLITESALVYQHFSFLNGMSSRAHLQELHTYWLSNCATHSAELQMGG